VKEDAHGDFTPVMMKISQGTWIETFLEGVAGKSTRLDYPYSRRCPGSCTSSLRSWLRGSFTHTNMVLREILDTTLHPLPWDIQFVIMT
jgi:hypothetical protein